jgi:hypothetical protein
MVDRLTRHHEELARELELDQKRAGEQAQRAERLARRLRELRLDPDSVH